MSALGEQTLALLLTDTESLVDLIRDGMDPKILPTETFRDVTEWAVAYYNQNSKAPSIDIMKERWGVVFEDAHIEVDQDVEETMGWAIDNLKQDYLQLEVGKFTRNLATSVHNADPENRIEVLGERLTDLTKVYSDLMPRTNRIDIRDSGAALLAEYEIAANSEGVRGMRTGLPDIDNHFGGIWPGELFVLGGPAGVGKSFFADLVAYNEWERGSNTAIFTLENSITMTQMRLACMALRFDITLLQTGELQDAEVAQLREWCNDVLLQSDTPLHIINPDMIGRTPQNIVQLAKSLEVESLVVDQLSHLQAADSRNQDRRNEVSSIVRMLADQISTGRNTLPCFLLHQIKREGITRAASTGRMMMTDFAESSEVERTASGAATLYQSAENAAMGEMQWQTLKARRVQTKHWEMFWAPWQGLVHVRNEMNFDETDPQGIGES